jgi:4a-hydroxytetrahydrobiopterin dehydratase
MQRKVLTADELREVLTRLKGWQMDGDTIKRRFEFPDFSSALRFVNEVAELAEEADHHPDITFGWGFAELALTTHDRGGVTDVDIALAERIDAI